MEKEQSIYIDFFRFCVIAEPSRFKVLLQPNASHFSRPLSPRSKRLNLNGPHYKRSRSPSPLRSSKRRSDPYSKRTSEISDPSLADHQQLYSPTEHSPYTGSPSYQKPKSLQKEKVKSFPKDELSEFR